MKKPLFSLFFTLFHALIAHSQAYQAGVTYLGTQNYIEFRAGNLPIIITAPHGGRLEPTTIPDRNCATCTTVMDGNTMELAYQIDTALRQAFGCFPNIIVNRLHRKKLDANREIVEAALGSADAELAWQEWHKFIQAAKNDVVRRYGRGILIDLHGHGHTIQRLELGYLTTESDLRLSDATLATPQYRDKMSIKNLVLNNRNNFNALQLLRGEFALGTLLAANNFPSVPSQQDPAPAVADEYFNGGYNTGRHGSRDSTTIDAIQIECNFTGVRNTFDTRRAFATQLANTLKVYLGKHYFTSTNFGCATAVLDLNLLDISVFPNPAKQQLNINFEKPLISPLTASLYNLQGQLIIEKTINVATEQAVLEVLHPLSIGAYILTFRDEKGGFVKQIKVLFE
jgi:N-formylglutamate amidohydrolase